MRKSLESILKRDGDMPNSGRQPGWNLPDHLGLAYGLWGPVAFGGDSLGKVPDGDLPGWLRAIADKNIPEDYQGFFKRWKRSLLEGRTVMVEIVTHSRLLIGHGDSGPNEVGLTLHHTWGVPMIPGSALKGVLAHYVETTYGPADPPSEGNADELQAHPGHPYRALLAAEPDQEQERLAYQGVTWAGAHIKHGPGEIYRFLFGAPAAESDRALAELGMDGVGAMQGSVIFHDALIVPEKEKTEHRPLMVDVLTPHQQGYYRGERDTSNDYDAPIPVSFLSVKPGTRFLVAVTGPDREWAEFAMKLLVEALDTWGIGAKTFAGYGRMSSLLWVDWLEEAEKLKQEDLEHHPLIDGLKEKLSGLEQKRKQNQDKYTLNNQLILIEHYLACMQQENAEEESDRSAWSPEIREKIIAVLEKQFSRKKNVTMKKNLVELVDKLRKGTLLQAENVPNESDGILRGKNDG